MPTYHAIYESHEAKIGKRVKLYAVSTSSNDGRVIVGMLYNIDPETGTCVVLQPSSEDVTSVLLKCVFADTIEFVEEVQGESTPALIRLQNQVQEYKGTRRQPIDLPRRRAAVEELLRKNRIPYQIEALEENDGSMSTPIESFVLFNGQLRLNPPYEARDCVCRNEMILQQLHTLLESLS